jgi:hypothetical protein
MRIHDHNGQVVQGVIHLYRLNTGIAGSNAVWSMFVRPGAQLGGGSANGATPRAADFNGQHEGYF